MLAFMIVICIIALLNMRNNRTNEFLSIEQTTTVNGFFVIIIFLGHANQYIFLDNNLINQFYIFIDNQIGQLCVAPFLFFSGYGIRESINHKNNYIFKMFRNRILVTLINFDIAIALYFLMNNTLGISYDISRYLYALIGADHVGNSNWYVFTILSMYTLTWVTGTILPHNNKYALFLLIFCIFFIIIMKYYFKFPSRFYSTVMCYPLGMFLSEYKDTFINFINKHKRMSYLAFLVPMFVIIILHLRNLDFIYNIFALLFIILMARTLYSYTINSRILFFLGKHCFSIYILQRIPMTIFIIVLGTNNCSQYMFLIITLLSTLALSILFDNFTQKIDLRIRNK